MQILTQPTALSFVLGIAAFLQPNSAYALQANAAPAAAPTEDPTDDTTIVVIAEPRERSSIDRTSYIVRDNAEARASSTLDVLARVPSVDVSPSGQIRLLGRSGVTILIDGIEVANPLEFLRHLQGSQAARIEVISNPSAQFSARGAAGIINIFTRRSFSSGLGGSVTAQGGTFGDYDLKASPTWSIGKLSLAGGLGIGRSVSRGEFSRVLKSVASGTGVELESTEEGDRRNDNDSKNVNFRATYRPTAKQSVTFSLFVTNVDGNSSRESQFHPSDDDNPLRQSLSGQLTVQSRDLSADYSREGARDGEMLTLSVKRSTSEFHTDNVFSTEFRSGPASPFRVDSNTSNAVTTSKLDFVRPFDHVRRLSLGGAIQRSRDVLHLLRTGLSDADTFSVSSTIQGSWLEKAAYVTYQLPLLGGTALAGLRVEDRQYNFADDPSSRSGTHLFPSLHLERDVTGWLKAKVSYSRRIDWPSITELDPTLRFSDPTTAAVGNPFLRPEITESYEAKLQAGIANQRADLTVYSNRTRDLLTSLIDVNDGVLVTRPINLRTRISRGADLSVRGPLARGLRYSVNGNLADERIPQGGIDIDFRRAGVRYGASAELEYRDGVEGRGGADHITIRVRYSGAIDHGLVRTSSFVSANATWSHALTDRLSAVLTISDFIGTSVRITYLSQNITWRQIDHDAGPRFTLSLTRSLGTIPQR